jgi:hypothetical protein
LFRLPNLEILIFAFEMGLTAGVTGRKGMLTPPRHLMPPLVFPEVRVCPILSFVFMRLVTVCYLCHFMKHLVYDVWKCKTNTIPILMQQMHISTTQVSSVTLWSKKLKIRKKNAKTVKEPMKTKKSAMTLSQIIRRIELCMRETILPFEMNL